MVDDQSSGQNTKRSKQETSHQAQVLVLMSKATCLQSLSHHGWPVNVKQCPTQRAGTFKSCTA